MSRSPWLDDKPAPDVRVLSHDELLDVWADNRNNLLGHVASDELTKRLHAERQIHRKETPT